MGEDEMNLEVGRVVSTINKQEEVLRVFVEVQRMSYGVWFL